MTLLRAAKILSICLSVSAVIAAVAGFTELRRAVDEALVDSRSRLGAADIIRHEKDVLTPISSPYVRTIQAARRTRDVVAFRDGYAAATDGGLLMLSRDGERRRHLNVLDGLPDSDLTALAVFGDVLFIGTRTAGLVAYDGDRFVRYRLHADNTSAVSALLNTGDKLMIGTFGGGVIEFDGSGFKRIGLESDGAINVSALASAGENLYIGTFDRGLLIRTPSSVRRMTTVEGLPSNRITGLADNEGRTYIATDLGFGVLENDAFRQLAIVPALSGIAFDNGRLILSRQNGELLVFDKELSVLSETKSTGSMLKFADDTIWHLSTEGISRIEHGRRKPFGTDDKNELTDNFISAIAFDPGGNIWIGTFRKGIDVLGPEGRELRHIESDETHQINFLSVEDGQMTAATAAGVFGFKDGMTARPSPSSAAIPAGPVMHFSEKTIATANGLAVRDGGRLRMMSAVQGLPSNSTYTSIEHAGRAYVGTINGLAEIEGIRVARVFDDTNSGLTTNWVTALCTTGERLFIGTYGGGIFELMPSGEIRSFEPETGKFAVNINALYTDGERLYAGTLDGVRVLDLRSQKWSRLVRELPARTVMAINGTGDAVYFGTTNGIGRIEKAYFQQTNE